MWTLTGVEMTMKHKFSIIVLIAGLLVTSIGYWNYITYEGGSYPDNNPENGFWIYYSNQADVDHYTPDVNIQGLMQLSLFREQFSLRTHLSGMPVSEKIMFLLLMILAHT